MTRNKLEKQIEQLKRQLDEDGVNYRCVCPEHREAFLKIIRDKTGDDTFVEMVKQIINS